MIRLNGSIGYVLDVDASKVIEAVRSTGVTVTPAMMHYAHYLISNMKNIGTWDLCNAVYGFVGGTAASHKFNWKNPIDTDAAFRLTYGGNVTHNSLGIKGDGSTAFGDTKLIPSTYLTTNSTHLSLYCNFYSSVNGVDFGAGEGSGGSTDNRINISLQFSGLILTDQYSFSGGGRASVTMAGSKGFYLTNRESSTSLKLIKNGLTIASNTSSATLLSLPNRSIYILAENRFVGTTNYTQRGFGFATIGAGLTDTQAIQQSQIVTNAQNILNRA